jgi:tRNA A-37 threonylcarbamoyl transferase component Bud32
MDAYPDAPMRAAGGAEIPLAELRARLAGFRCRAGRRRPGFSLEGLLAEVRACRVVKAGRRRTVFELSAGGQGYFLKMGAAKPSVRRATELLRWGRRWAEWRNLHRLLDRGLAACIPVLRGQGTGRAAADFFLVTEKVDGRPLGAGVEPPALGAFLAGLHAAGAYAADLHPNNLLIRTDGSPCLIDAQAVFFLPWMPRRLRASSLGKLLHYLSGDASVPPAWWAAVLAAYNRAAGAPLSPAEVEAAAGAFRRRRERSRSRRCLVDSSGFERVRGPGAFGYRRRDFGLGPEEIERLFEGGRPLKEGHVREAQGLCIKMQGRRLLHRDRCLAGWKMSHALAVRGIPVARALAYYRLRGRRYLVTEYLEGGTPLNPCLSALAGAALRRRLAEFAGWLRRIHAAGVWQHDFKSANVLCHAGRFHLLDLDGVRFGRISRRRVLVNLAQLNASVSHAVGLRDRLRFYGYYTRGQGFTRRQRRAEYRAIWEISATKNTAASGLELNRLRPGRARG